MRLSIQGSVMVFATLAFCASAQAGVGNRVPSGGCYNVQVIAMPKSKTADMSGDDGRSLFIMADARTKILLSEGQFDILDRNGTDGTASFQLPNPDQANSGSTAYSVFARLVGKPGSGIDLATCGVDASNITYCSQDTLSMSRIAGTSKFLNVSQQMLYIYADLNADGTIERVPLFDSRLTSYFWQLDSMGRAHLQLRFCPVSTTVN